MNLTRMRNFHLEDHCYAAYQSYKGKLDLPDQDIYNIVFHSFPRKSSFNNQHQYLTPVVMETIFLQIFQSACRRSVAPTISIEATVAKASLKNATFIKRWKVLYAFAMKH